MGHCPEDCYDKCMEANRIAKENDEAINDKQTGILVILNKISTCLNDKVSGKSIRYFMIASMGVLLTAFGFVWDVSIQAEKVPELKEMAVQAQQLSTDNKERIHVQEVLNANMDKDIDDLKNGLNDVVKAIQDYQKANQEKFDRIIERLPNAPTRP